MKDAMSIVAHDACTDVVYTCMNFGDLWMIPTLLENNFVHDTVPASRQGVDKVGGMALKILGHNMPLVQ